MIEREASRKRHSFEEGHKEPLFREITNVVLKRRKLDEECKNT
jgi:hypothetical protein